MAQRWHSIFFTYSIPFPVLMHVSRDQCFNGSQSWPCSAFDTGATNFHLRHPYWFLNCQIKNSKTLKGSHRIERGRNFLKISTPLFLIKIYQMRLLSARTISLDSTLIFKKLPMLCIKSHIRYSLSCCLYKTKQTKKISLILQYNENDIFHILYFLS